MLSSIRNVQSSTHHDAFKIILPEDLVDNLGQGTILLQTVDLGSFAGNEHFAFSLFNLVFLQSRVQLSQFGSHICNRMKPSVKSQSRNLSEATILAILPWLHQTNFHELENALVLKRGCRHNFSEIRSGFSTMNDDDLHVIQSRTRLKSEIFFLKDQFFCIVPSIFVCVWLDIFSGENLVLQVSFGWFYGESSIFCKGYHALDKSASLRTKNKTIFKNESFQKCLWNLRICDH